MNNVSLYRKYRPNEFSEVVGQKNIVQTLVNEIKMDKLTHAYLFSGPRGCGKTSIAKIFAKQINDVDNSNYVDIWEMDAASNNGVEEIRKVIDSVNYLPVELKYKVYIIDEVHMLSKAAFNALLKTLEEPPAYAIFILATTEIQKIPATIISRCQRFDFNRIDIDSMVSRMEEILLEEKIEYDIDALTKIANLADGALRDALSILESIISTQGKVDNDGINKVLNIVDNTDIETILEYIDNKEIEEVLKYYHELKVKGIDDVRFLNDIINAIKEKIVYEKNYYYSKFLPLLTDASYNIEQSKAKSLVLEILFIQLCDLEIIKTTTKTIIEKPSIKEEVAKVAPIEEKVEKTEIKLQPEVEIEEDELEVIEEDKEPFGFIDVLKNATVEAKNKYTSQTHNFAAMANSRNLMSLSIFFEEATIVAASNNAIIISTNDTFINDFSKKIDEISDIIKCIEPSCEYVFLIGNFEWQQKRQRYIDELKKEKTIYDTAVTNFGHKIVRKV